jgi:SAM-dependent methyltransferase
MTSQNSWYSQDTFWETFEPMIFNEHRLTGARDEVEKIVNLLRIEAGAQILDLPCGIGRHSLELSQRGFSVIGVDRTKAYIEKARAEAARRTLTAEFEIGDMQMYCAPGRFDVALNLFGSFGYFDDAEDDQRMVKNVFASLRPGGRFLIETMGKEILARDFQAKDWSEDGGLVAFFERKVTPNWERIETRWITIRGAERSEHYVSICLYSAKEMSALLTRCGFAEVKVFGSLDGSPYDYTAQRLVAVARK